MNQGNMKIKNTLTFPKKIMFKSIGHCILILTMMLPHNYASSLRIFSKFSTIKETRRSIKIILMFFLPKENMFAELNYFWSENDASEYI